MDDSTGEKSQLRRRIDQGAVWLMQKLEGGIRFWMTLTRQGEVPQYHDYIEAIVAECGSKRVKWRTQGISEARILLMLIPEGIDVLRGIGWLTVDRYAKATSLFLHANDEFLRLLEAIDSPSSSSILRLKRFFRLIHRITGNVKRPVPKIRIRLSATAQVTGWDAEAETFFGLQRQDVVGRDAVGLFVPQIESGGRIMSSHLREVCAFQTDFSLNVNQNQNGDGQKFWMFWVNVPLRDPAGIITELLCVGMPTQDPYLMRAMVRLWRGWRQLRRRTQLQWARFLSRYP